MSDGLSIHSVHARGEFVRWLQDRNLTWTFENFQHFARSGQSEALDYLFNAIFSPDIYEDENSLRSFFDDMQVPDSSSGLTET